MQVWNESMHGQVDHSVTFAAPAKVTIPTDLGTAAENLQTVRPKLLKFKSAQQSLNSDLATTPIM